jgi:PhnB protein
MQAINPYLNFNGTTEEAFNFYKSVFGGEFDTVMRFGEMPPMPGAPPTPESAKQKIMHISLPLASGGVLMGSDAIEGFGPPVQFGNNFYISINAESKTEADKLFNSLSAGGQIEMPMSDMFWGSYWGSFKDKYGTGWMISFGQQQQ